MSHQALYERCRVTKEKIDLKKRLAPAPSPTPNLTLTGNHSRKTGKTTKTGKKRKPFKLTPLQVNQISKDTVSSFQQREEIIIRIMTEYHQQDDLAGNSEYLTVLKAVLKIKAELKQIENRRSYSINSFDRRYKTFKLGQESKPSHGNQIFLEVVLDAIASWVEAGQLTNESTTPAQIITCITALLVGAPPPFCNYNPNSVYARAVNHHPEELGPMHDNSIEERRSKWLTITNCLLYAEATERTLVEFGFCADSPSELENGDPCLVTFYPGMEDRILNMDETHILLSNAPDKGGPRSSRRGSSDIAPGQTKIVEAAGHITMFVTATAAGGVLPPFFIFKSSAKDVNNLPLKETVYKGLPKVRGRRTTTIWDSYVALNDTGSMNDELFPQFVEEVFR
jgi:hypothetical protein